MKYLFFFLLLQFVVLHAQESSPYYIPRRPAQPEKTEDPKKDLAPADFLDAEFKERSVRKIIESRLNIRFGYSYAEMHDLVMASSDINSTDFPLQSQIDWKLQDILTLSASFGSRIQRLYFHFGVSVPLILTDAPMSKRDWYFDNPPSGVPTYDFPSSAPSQYSSAGTRTEFSFSLDGSLLFNLLEEPSPRIELGTNFLYMTWGTVATARDALYLLDDTGATGFNSPPENESDSINFRIHYLVPALSMRFSMEWGVYGFEAQLNYSPSAFFISHHDYYFSNEQADSFGVLGQMLWGGVTNYFWLNTYVALNVGLRGKVLFRTRIGGREQKNTDTGLSTSAENTAGSEYFDLEVFIGVTMGF